MCGTRCGDHHEKNWWKLRNSPDIGIHWIFFQQIWFKDISTAEFFVVAIEQEGIIHEKNPSNNLKITKDWKCNIKTTDHHRFEVVTWCHPNGAMDFLRQTKESCVEYYWFGVRYLFQAPKVGLLDFMVHNEAPPNGMRIILVANFWVCFSRLRRYSCFEHISEDCGTSQSRATLRFPNSWYPQVTQIGPLKTMESHGDDWRSPRKWQDGRVLCPPPNIGVLGATVVKTSRIFNYKTGFVWFPK